MRACGLIVEYNPFHYGHLHHLETAKKESGADCMIAVMSGSFLQRGEPAIIDKVHRTRAALAAGVDIVIELPYRYAVQNSTIFAQGAIKSLYHMGASSICFGSESGEIMPFLLANQLIQQHKVQYEGLLQSHLKNGVAFPVASSKAYQEIGIHSIDLFQPNNILGLSYVQAIQDQELPITPLTIKRLQSQYHDIHLSTPIASATSIRKSILDKEQTSVVNETIPDATVQALETYKKSATIWHHWENYFPLLAYQVMTKTIQDLGMIHGVDEGLEYRIHETGHIATSFHHWLSLIKTKRYTQTRLQRMFVHILTNTTKEAIATFSEVQDIPYLRLLGFSKTGQAYLHQQKKRLDVPIYSSLNRANLKALRMDEKATETYYAILPPKVRHTLRKQEFQLPIRL
jgi:predicted nucleotidyltransferase